MGFQHVGAVLFVAEPGFLEAVDGETEGLAFVLGHCCDECRKGCRRKWLCRLGFILVVALVSTFREVSRCSRAKSNRVSTTGRRLSSGQLARD